MENSNSTEKKNTLIIVAIIAAVVIIVLVLIVLPIVLFFNSFNSSKKNIQEEASSIIEKGKEETSEIRKESKVNDFNNGLGIFSVDNDGEEVKEIISSISESNSKNSQHIVTVTFNGSNMSSTQQLNDLITKIDSDKEYTITKEYDADGYIVKVNIA